LDSVQEWIQQPAVPHLSVLISQEGIEYWAKHVIDHNIYHVLHQAGLLEGEAPYEAQG
jgi:hypothetical protein